MSKQNELTHDEMLKVLETNGYNSSYIEYGWFSISAPDQIAEFHARRDIWLNQAIETAYAHYQQAQEVELMKAQFELLRHHYKELFDAAKWVLYTTIHGVSIDGGNATMQEKEDAIETLQSVIASQQGKRNE